MAGRNSGATSANRSDAVRPGANGDATNDIGNTGKALGGDGSKPTASGPGGQDNDAGSGVGDATGQGGGAPDAARPAPAATPAPTRRGRPPGPAKPKSDAGTAATDKPLPLGGFRPNDRTKVLSQIQAMHGMAAVLMNMPVLILSPEETKAMTFALCDVLDYHRVNITEGGGPWGMYLALAMTGYQIYSPRLAYIARGGDATLKQAKTATAPATPGEVKVGPVGAMDFSADIAH